MRIVRECDAWSFLKHPLAGQTGPFWRSIGIELWANSGGVGRAVSLLVGFFGGGEAPSEKWLHIWATAFVCKHTVAGARVLIRVDAFAREQSLLGIR